MKNEEHIKRSEKINEDSDNVKEKKESEKLDWCEISTEHIVQDEWIDFRRSA